MTPTQMEQEKGKGRRKDEEKIPAGGLAMMGFLLLWAVFVIPNLGQLFDRLREIGIVR